MTLSGIPGQNNIGQDTIVITANDGYGGTATAAFQIIIKSATVQSVQKYGSLDVRVFPNPASDKIIISSGESMQGSVELVDFTGRVLFSSEERFSDNLTINLEELNMNSGMYYLKIRTSDKRVYSGLVVKK